MIQYSFVAADEEAAAARTDEFVSAAGSCTTYSPTAGVTIDVTEITDIEPVGESFAAVRGENRAAEGNDQEFVVFRNGAAVTVLQSYSRHPRRPRRALRHGGRGLGEAGRDRRVSSTPSACA